jgi:hypothetical protein
MFPGQRGKDLVSPFDHQWATIEQMLQVEVNCFTAISQAVGIQVGEAFPIGAAVDIDQHKGGAGDGIGGTPSGGHALHQSGFSGA